MVLGAADGVGLATDGLLIRLDSDGDVVSAARLTTAQQDWIYGVAAVGADTVVAGAIGTPGGLDADCWLARVRPDYSIDWKMTYGGSEGDELRAVAEFGSPLSLVVGAGFTRSLGVGDVDGLVLIVDEASGAPVSTWTYGGTATDKFLAMAASPSGPDSGYLLVGSTTSFGAAMSDAWIVRLALDGTLLWQERFGGSGIDTATAVRRTSDGGFIVAGTTSSFGAGCNDAFLLRLDAFGSMVWCNAYGTVGTESANAVEVQGNSFILFGKTDGGVGCWSNDQDAWLLSVDQSGALEWTSSYGTVGEHDEYHAATVGLGGAIVAVGESHFTGAQGDALVTRLSGCTAQERPCDQVPAVAVTGTSLTPAATIATQQSSTPFPFILAANTFSIPYNTERSVPCRYWIQTVQAAQADTRLKSLDATRLLPNGFLLAGYREPARPLSKLAAAWKFADFGDREAAFLYGLPGWDFEAHAAVGLPDGGFVLGGNAREPFGGADDGFLLRCDAMGNVLWARTYEPLGGSLSIEALAEGQLDTIGVVGSGSADPSLWVASVSLSSGSVLWQRAYSLNGFTLNADRNSIAAHGDTYYVVATISEVLAFDDFGWIAAIDQATGTLVFQQSVDGPDRLAEWSVDVADGGTTLAVAGAASGGGFFLKFGIAPQWVLWSVRFPSIGFRDIEELANGDLALVGSSLQSRDGIRLRYSSGSGVWSARQYGDGMFSTEDFFWATLEVADGDLVTAGSTYAFGGGTTAVAWMLRTDANGDVGSGPSPCPDNFNPLFDAYSLVPGPALLEAEGTLVVVERSVTRVDQCDAMFQWCP